MQNEKSLFDLSVDMTGKAHLREAARWGRMLAIIGFIGLGFLIVFSVVLAMVTPPSPANDGTLNDKTAEVAGALIGSVLVAVLYFFPCLFLHRFAAKLKTAIDANDVVNLNESFRNLKITLRYVGVVTIIFLALLAIGLLAEI